MTILKTDFFTREPIQVAKDLLGKYICRCMPNGDIICGKICELELYTQEERGCHAFNGRMTKSNKSMFLPGGYAYVYLCYGMYNMFNIVVGPIGYAAGCFIRALELEGCDGPGKLTNKLNITKKEDGLFLCKENGIWIEQIENEKIEVVASTRIGINFADEDSKLLYRFYIKNSGFISKLV